MTSFDTFLDAVAAGQPVTPEAFARSAIGELPKVETAVRKLDPKIWPSETFEDLPE